MNGNSKFDLFTLRKEYTEYKKSLKKYKAPPLPPPPSPTSAKARPSFHNFCEEHICNVVGKRGFISFILHENQHSYFVYITSNGSIKCQPEGPPGGLFVGDNFLCEILYPGDINLSI